MSAADLCDNVVDSFQCQNLMSSGDNKIFWTVFYLDHSLRWFAFLKLLKAT